MKARVEPRWEADSVRVWLYRQAGQGMEVLRLGGDWLSFETVDHGALLPDPTLELPTDALSALLEAAQDFKPPSSAQAAHLDDAVTTRDRLLALIEKRGLR